LTSLDGRVTALEAGSPVAPSAFTVGQWTVTATGATGAISIDLTALPSNGGSAITALEYRIGAGAAVALSGTGTGARTVTGLTDGVSVDIQVRAVNTIGNGAWSDTKSVTPATVPAAFTAGQWTAAATGTPGEITFNLTALPSTGGSAITALEYRVGSGAAIAFAGTGTGVRVVTAGLTAGVAVDLQVRAVNAVGSGAWSDIKNRTPLAGSTAPAAFTAGQWTAAATSTPGEISFDLTALPSDGGSAITALEYRVGAGAAIAFTGTGTGVRVVTAGLTAGVAVDLQVRAVNAIGNGAWSDVKNRTPLATPTAPAAFVVGNWTLTAGDTLLVANITALPSDGGSAITALQYRLDGGTAVAFSGTGTGSRNITSLTNATEYDVEIRAVNPVGNGAWSDLKSGTPAAAGGGAAVWEGVESTVGNIGGAGTTPTRPSGVVSTDLLVLVLSSITVANVAAITVPTGWTLRGEVHSEIADIGHAIYTASGSVADAVWTTGGATATVAFDMHRISGANLTTPVRSFTGRTTVTWTPVSAADMPSPAATATAGDMVFAHYHQPQSNTAVGTPTAGYTRRVTGGTADRRSTLTRANVSAGTTGEISHAASAAWEGRTSSTILIAAA
jgi:hypothetical protein